MTNGEIANRILAVIQRYRRGEGSLSEIESAIELYEPLLEGVTYSDRKALHAFMARIYEEDISPLEEQRLGIKASRDAIDGLAEALDGMKSQSGQPGMPLTKAVSGKANVVGGS